MLSYEINDHSARWFVYSKLNVLMVKVRAFTDLLLGFWFDCRFRPIRVAQRDQFMQGSEKTFLDKVRRELLPGPHED